MPDTKISISKPPIWEEALKHFKFDEDVIVFTYADIIYNPGGHALPEDVIVHEETHMQQQARNETAAKLWWQRYFLDPAFRIDQEVEAYANQYKFLCKNTKNREKRAKILHQIGFYLSGPMYGRAIKYPEAIHRVRMQAEN